MKEVLLRGLDDAKTSVLKVTIPESWESKPCSKLLKVWRKHKEVPKECVDLCLCANDGTPVAEEWSVEAVVAIYEGEVWVREVKGSAEEALAAANKAYSEGEYALATREYEKALQEKKWLGRSQAVANMAAAKMMLGQYGMALQACEAALSDESCAGILRDRVRVRAGRCQVYLGNADSAEDYFCAVLEEGTAASGDASEAAAELATAAIEGQNRAKVFANVLRSARKTLDAALHRRELYSTCLESASEAMALAPLSSEAAGIKCRALCGLKLWSAAAGFYQEYHELIDSYKGKALDRALSLDIVSAYSYADPENISFLLNRWIHLRPRSSEWINETRLKQTNILDLKVAGNAAVRAKRFIAAEQAYRSALDLDPEHPIIRANLAAVLQATARYKEAADQCRKAILSQPIYPRLRLRMARCLSAMGQAEQALDAYQAYFNDCTISQTTPDPNASLEHSALHTATMQQQQAEHDWNQDEERTFYENYRLYAQRFARSARRKESTFYENTTNQSEPDESEPSTRTAALSLFGLTALASTSDIKARYRELILLYHPDKSSLPDAETKFRQVRTAYQNLLHAP